jgi:putative sterol carrier protein
MPAFASDTEVYKYIGGVFREGLSNPAILPKLQESGVILQITYSDPDAVLTIDFAGGEVHEGQVSVRPNVEMFMSADSGNQFWLGQLNLSVAMAKGQVRTKGSVSKILKLVPIAKDLFPSYRKALEEDGRSDLLNA